MDFTLTVNVSVEHVEGSPRAAKEAILESIKDIIDVANPVTVETDNEGQYEVSVWDVDEA